MRRIFWALPLLFLVAVPLLLFNPSETVNSGYPVRWTLVTPTSSLLKHLGAEYKEEINSATNTTVALKVTPMEKPRHMIVSSPLKDLGTEHKEEINNATNTTVVLKVTPIEKPRHVFVRKLTKDEKEILQKYTPNELAFQKLFLADQAAVQSIPTEAPGWVYNKTTADLFRQRAISRRQFRNGSFLVTQENTHVNTTLKTYFGKPGNITVTPKELRRFPKESPFKTRRFKTCSVVGNGGILNGSGCGEEIDASEFVFRQEIHSDTHTHMHTHTDAHTHMCNTAPMDDKYWKDIGRRTNLITMNPSQVYFRYNSFGNNRTLEKIAFQRASKAFKEAKGIFRRDLSVYGDSYLFIEAFLYELSAKRAFLAHQVLLESHAKYEVIFPHPDFIRSVHSYWKRTGVVAQRVSTGLLMASVATQICEEVHLYGFWPFHSDRNNRRLTEHYYDNALPSNAHKISEEFKQLQRLHNTGVLRLTTTACH
ncbi:ST8SIA6 [Branchiostoma lanceolatum]|uniref:ST8SIA6 protein n=1 Tax=Branchiostoma lanceolatum TaxID=7740 RepID=A0A8J9YJW0_BRALA|nr:ST8SIA6 [Branchiostoma lanceolatum]